MLKGLLLIAAGSLSVALSAATLAEPLNYVSFQGLYMGVGAAENDYSFMNKYAFNPATVPGASALDQENDFNKSNLNPAVTFGYAGIFNDNIFAAIETNANFNEIQRTQGNTVSTTDKFIFTNSYNLLGKIGYLFQEINLGYALVGMSKTNLRREVTYTGAFAPLGISPLNQTQNIFGPVFGVGYERAYNQYLHFAIEFNHIYYSRTDYPLQSGSLGVNKVYLSQDTLLLKAIYYL